MSRMTYVSSCRAIAASTMARGARLADWRHCSAKGKRRKLGSRLDPDNTKQVHNFLTPEIVKLAFRESVYREIEAELRSGHRWHLLRAFVRPGQCEFL